MKHTYMTGLIVAVGLLAASSSHAATGWVKGYAKFYNNMGNYCPSGENCSGARYTQSSHNTYLGIPDAKVNVYGSGHTLIGSGTTNSSGYFNIFWNSGAASTPSAAHIHVYPIHKDNRFRLRKADTSSYHGNTSTFALSSGSTTDVGSRYWSSSDYFKNYWAAWKLWTRLDDSNGMTARFNDVWIYGFADSIGNGTGNVTCTTSCARGWYDQGGGPGWANDHPSVLLNDGAELLTIHRIMHEIGHVVHYFAGNRFRFGGSYNYLGDSGWSMTDRERRPAALSEGFATFVSMAGLYNDHATEPMECFSSGHCYSSGRDIEESQYTVSGGCTGVTEPGRWPVNSTRYFWDIYDEVDDGRDGLDANFHDVIDTFYHYTCSGKPDCYGYQQKHSQFDFVADDLSSISYESNLDAGHQWEFQREMDEEESISSSEEYYNNCLGYF